MNKKVLFGLIFFSNIFGALSIGVSYSMGTNSLLDNAVGDTVHPLNANELAEKIFEQHRMEIKDPVLQSEAWNDLELDLFIQRNNRCVTTFGRAGLATLLQPTRRLEVVLARQKLIKKLVDATDCYSTMQRCLRSLALSQQSLLDYWQSDILPLDQRVQQHYFKFGPLKRFNNSQRALFCASMLSLLGGAASVGSLLLGEGWDKYAAELATPGGHKNPLRVLQYGVNKIVLSHSFRNGPLINFNQAWEDAGKDLDPAAPAFRLQQAIKLYANSTNRSLLEFSKDWAANLFDWREEQGLINWRIIATLAPQLFLTIGGDIARVQVVHDTYKDVVTRINDIKLLQIRLCDIGRLISTSRKLSQTLRAEGYSGTTLEPLQLIEDFLAQLESDTELNELAMLLHDSLFTKKCSASLCLSPGKVLRANALICCTKQHFIPLMHAIGQLDGLFSMATLVMQHEHKHAKFSFVEFDFASDPEIVATNAWVPLLPADQAVVNDIKLGNGAPTTMMLTGPNGSGKSTIMKAVAYQLILGLSVGVIPASNGVITPFDLIVTYKHPEENIALNKSTFMAQKESAQKLAQLVEIAPATYKIALFIDEPFNGTIEREAAKRSCRLFADVCVRSNVVGVLATHFESPVFLAQNFPSIFANYQLELAEESNKFIRTFRLLKGAAHWWFHDEDRCERFIDQLD